MKKTFQTLNQIVSRAVFFHAIYTVITPPLSDEFLEAVQAKFQANVDAQGLDKGLKANEIFEHARKAAIEVSQEWAAQGKEVFS